jgi:hypothetical protein
MSSAAAKWALAIAGAVLAVLLLVIVIYRRGRAAAGFRGGQAGPYNIGLYDRPYIYPRYRGRAATRWAADGRCVAYCGGGRGCTVWCR